jgi:hypothetical protein
LARKAITTRAEVIAHHRSSGCSTAGTSRVERGSSAHSAAKAATGHMAAKATAACVTAETATAHMAAEAATATVTAEAAPAGVAATAAATMRRRHGATGRRQAQRQRCCRCKHCLPHRSSPCEFICR